ncbi:shikimate kinase [Nocardia tengchongensis]|uniref:shikimate kinase n=1 Tax=Nocardia tengchongensis TaxID=2055889 RepID=UPI00368853DA
MVLIGPPGAGKSTVGRVLAERLGVDFRDTDDLIREDLGSTIPEIFTRHGEAGFRRIEEHVVRAALVAHRGILALGGGAVLSGATRALLLDRTVVCLDVDVEEGLRRIAIDSDRPLFTGANLAADYAEVLRQRQPLYRDAARIVVETSGRTPDHIAHAVLAGLGLRSRAGGEGAGDQDTIVSGPDLGSKP